MFHSSSVVIYLIACLCSIGDTNHYLGGTFNWRSLSNGKVQVSWTISWVRDVEESLRPIFDCQGRQEILGEGLLICLNCSNPTAYRKPLRLNCVSYSIEDGSSTGHNSFVFDPRDKNTLLSQFTLSYQRSKNITRSSSYWRKITNYGGGSMYKLWRMMIEVDTSINNASPIATFPPIYVVQHSCGNVTIKLTVFDPDGDEVRCRWATGPSECPPGIMNVVPVCGPISPHAVMNEERCEYTFPVSALDYSHPDYGNRLTSYWFAVPITVEDYRDGQRLSKVPVQYLIRVDKRAQNICKKPKLHIGQDCLYLLVGETWMLTLKADSSSGIKDIVVYPGTSRIRIFEFNDASTTKYGFRKISWTPTVEDSGQHFIYIYAIDNDGYRSDYKTVVINVIRKWAEAKIQETPEITSHYPTSTSVYDIHKRVWNITFDQKIQRPTLSRYVRVLTDPENKEIFQVDLSDENAAVVHINDRKTYHFNGPTLESGNMYRIVIENGATESESCDACTHRCAKFPSKGVTYQLLTGEKIVNTTDAPSICELVQPEIDIGRNCTYLQVEKIWKRTITAVNTHEFLSLVIEGINGMIIKDGYLDGDFYVRELSWRPSAKDKGRHQVHVVALGTQRMSSITEVMELIVVDQAPKDQDNISGPSVVTSESEPYANEVLASPITNITITFDMKISKPANPVFIRIQHQSNPSVAFKVDASGDSVTIDDVTRRKMIVPLPDATTHGTFRVRLDPGVALFLFCDACNSTPTCNVYQSLAAQWEFHVEKCDCNSILQRLSQVEERLVRLESTFSTQ
ncbi:uncharacterized protein LOC117106807 [Anneissia japonica]|uniref:uncharacterized protein LOC117106807 n=1 Tax=Anneissia japonica TaxID=1529436 RepID=UPI0014259B84|nr:uncharacterized protein LOC117106807 [Anneissia japonica]